MTFLLLNFSDIKELPEQTQTARVRNLAIKTHLHRSQKIQNGWVKYCNISTKRNVGFLYVLKAYVCLCEIPPKILSFLLCSSLKLNLVLALSLSVVHMLWCYPVLSSKVRASLLFLMVRKVIRMVECPIQSNLKKYVT